MLVVLPLVPLVLLSCASGGGSGASSSDALEGVTWILDSASIGSLVDHVPPNARVDLAFDGERASGRAACNSYGGSYTVDGEQLSFGSFAVTEMACEQPVMDLESAYLTALGSVDGYQVAGGGKALVLTGGNVALTFNAEEPVAPLPLVGTAWRLTTLASGTDAVSSTIAGTEVTAVFADDGTVSGTDGCNRYHATYTATDGSLSVGDLAGTRMMCADDVMQQATTFTGALTSASGFTIDGASLTLSDDTGAMLLAFDGTA